MSLNRDSVEQVATAYLEAGGCLRGSPFDDAYLAVDRMMKLAHRADAEFVWLAILKILEKRPASSVIGVLAAGPLEDLIDGWGAEFVARIELGARQNSAFRHLLGGVWLADRKPVSARLEKFRGQTW